MAIRKTSCIMLSTLFLFLNVSGQTSKVSRLPEQNIFVFGGDINRKFVGYVVDLTNKPNPKICYLPTASADNEDNIKYWEYICNQLSIDPSHILKVWVSSKHSTMTFEDILLDMDAIVVGGGNTLNMIAIWKAQGIDKILEKALKKGIILAGGSAGSICWFQNGISDSRPINLSIVDGLSFLPFSNCPHYADSLKKNMYQHKIKNREIRAGYASDDLSGILFRNGKFAEAVSINDINNSYYVSLKNKIIHSKILKSKILINKDALAEADYNTININKTLKDFPEILNQDSPLNAFISFKYILANGQQSKMKKLSSYYLKDRLSDSIPDSNVNENGKHRLLSTKIEKILIFKDSVAGIISKTDNGDFYGLWLFYKERGKWMNAGEDIGGDTVLQSEITFREKAKKYLEKVQQLPVNL